MSHIQNVTMDTQDTKALDAFGRFRVSNPFNVFDMQFTYDLQPLFFEESETGGGAVSHIANSSAARLTTGGVTDTHGIIFQTRQYFRYQPGKALRHGEPVLTPNGFVNIEDITIGDVVFDGLGERTKVVGVYPQGKRTIYRLTFDDGTHVDADGEHQWKTIIRRDSKKGQSRVLTTNQMLKEHGEEPRGFHRWKIPQAPVLAMTLQEVSIDPYTLGAVLGDGHIYKDTGSVGFTTADPEILEYLRCGRIGDRKAKYTYGLCGLCAGIKKYGLLGARSLTKFVPNEYKFNGEGVRLSVLRGLMDTDGEVDKRCGVAMFTSVSRQLAEDVSFLVRSLGGQAKIAEKACHYLDEDGNRVQCHNAFRVSVIMPVCPFRLSRKAFYWRPRTRISFDRYVHTIKEVGVHEATCIRVESEDHTFLTRGHVVTHNSQYVVFTCILGAKTANVRKRIGLFDADNGFFFEQDGTNLKIVRRTKTSGSVVDNAVNQSSWNLDVLDGSGSSGFTLDETKDNLFVVDFQWLGAGRIRFGFDFGGQVTYVHQIAFANTEAVPFTTTGNLPFRAEIFNIATAAGATTFDFTCCAVVSEGGHNPLGVPGSVQSAALRSVTTGNHPLPIISIRPRTTFNSITNRALVIPKTFAVISEDTSIRWEVILNGSLTTPSFANVDTTNSTMMVDVAAAAITGGVVVASGFLTGAKDAKESGTVGEDLMSKLALSNDIAGTVTDILTIAVSIINSGGVSSDCGGSFSWKEER